MERILTIGDLPEREPPTPASSALAGPLWLARVVSPLSA